MSRYETFEIIWFMFPLVYITKDEECGCLCTLNVSFHNVAGVRVVDCTMWLELVTLDKSSSAPVCHNTIPGSKELIII